VRRERRVAVRADDPEVLEPVVVMHAVDVIQDQRHPPAPPLLAETAQFAHGDFQTIGVEAVLEMTPAEAAVLDEQLLGRASFLPPRYAVRA